MADDNLKNDINKMAAENFSKEVTVATGGDYEVFDPYTGDTISAEGTTTVKLSPFIDGMIRQGKLTEGSKAKAEARANEDETARVDNDASRSTDTTKPKSGAKSN